MDNLEFTAHLYGNGQFRYSNNFLKLADGFIKYHKANFAKYFKIPEENFSGLRILETGCGPGHHAVVLALMGADVTAVDLSSQNIEKGQQLKAYYQLQDLNFIQHNLMQPLPEQEPFDLISAHNWVQHAENPAVILKNLISRLKRGGRFYLSLYQAGTFRFFISQIARGLLTQNEYSIMQGLVKYFFPLGFKEFNNPDDIYLENIFDDFFVPYCHTTTWDIVANDARKLGCVPMTPSPQQTDFYHLDNIPLRIGLEKKDGVIHDVEDLEFQRSVDEFLAPVPSFMRDSVKLAQAVIADLKEQKDQIAICCFCLGLYRIRASLSRVHDAAYKHRVLQAYLQRTLSSSLKSISAYHDTEQLYASSIEGVE